MSTLPEIWSAAIAAHKAGNFSEAEAGYRRILELQPAHAEALNNLGTVYRRLDRLEEAVGCLKEAIRLRPDFAEAYNNLGTAYKLQHRMDQALSAFQEALRMKPQFAAAHHNLGSLLLQQGHKEPAAAAYQRALELDPGDAVARFVLASLTGRDMPRTAPKSYVKRLFDAYAHSFERELLSELRYQGPRLLREALGDAAGHSLDILDLGCGTGLSGLACRDVARTLTGVDVSPVMLARAKTRGIYQRLIEGDILDAVKADSEAYDLILAGDTFIYFGDLAELFPAALRALRSGGRFVFDVEAYDGSGFTLRSSARYAHSSAYIRELATLTGFLELSCKKAFLRLDHGKEVDSYVFAFKKP